MNAITAEACISTAWRRGSLVFDLHHFLTFVDVSYCPRLVCDGRRECYRRSIVVRPVQLQHTVRTFSRSSETMATSAYACVASYVPKRQADSYPQSFAERCPSICEIPRSPPAPFFQHDNPRCFANSTFDVGRRYNLNRSTQNINHWERYRWKPTRIGLRIERTRETCNAADHLSHPSLTNDDSSVVCTCWRRCYSVELMKHCLRDKFRST